MAGFNALKFIFDGIPSEYYKMYLLDFDGSGVKTNSAGSNVEIIQDKILRKATPYFFGTSQNEPLEFEITIGTTEKIDRRDIAIIQKWLFGQTRRKKLQIQQCDLDNIYFNCFLINPQITSIGNIPYAFTCTVQCDAPWAWEFPRTGTFQTQEVETNLEFYNSSDDTDYLHPKIEITLDSTTIAISAINANDNNRVFAFENLVPNEKLIIDNELETIVSSTGLNRLNNFNGNWFRFVQGINKIRIIGGLTEGKITYQFARKVGS